MIEVDQAMAGDEQTSFAPVWKLGDEIRGACQFDVYGEFVLEHGDRLKETTGFGVGFQVDIDGHGAPAVKERGGTACEVDSPATFHAAPHRNHEGLEFFQLNGWAHEWKSEVGSRRSD